METNSPVRNITFLRGFWSLLGYGWRKVCQAGRKGEWGKDCVIASNPPSKLIFNVVPIGWGAWQPNPGFSINNICKTKKAKRRFPPTLSPHTRTKCVTCTPLPLPPHPTLILNSLKQIPREPINPPWYLLLGLSNFQSTGTRTQSCGSAIRMAAPCYWDGGGLAPPWAADRPLQWMETGQKN